MFPEDVSGLNSGVNKCTGSPPSPCYQLQKEEVRSHQPTSTKEEAKVNGSLIWRLGGVEKWRESQGKGFFACLAGCTCHNSMTSNGKMVNTNL
jgi:hypothetical protein